MRSYKAARRAAVRGEGALEPIPFEVTYEDKDGKEQTAKFQLRGQVSTVTITDLGYFADLDAATPQGAALIRRIFMEGFGDDKEFARFWRVAALLDEDTLIDIMGGVIEDTTGRPTKRPSESSAPSSTTGQPSRVASSPLGTLALAQEPAEFSD